MRPIELDAYCDSTTCCLLPTIWWQEGFEHSRDPSFIGLGWLCFFVTLNFAIE